jgi:hypothetical protein
VGVASGPGHAENRAGGKGSGAGDSADQEEGVKGENMGRAYADKNGQVWIEDNRTQRKPLKPYYIVTDVPRGEADNGESSMWRGIVFVMAGFGIGQLILMAIKVIVWLAQ